MLSRFTLPSILLFALATLSDGHPLNTTIDTIKAVSTEYLNSLTWAGVVLKPPVTFNSFTSATAVIHVPSISRPVDPSFAGSTLLAWVGIGTVGILEVAGSSDCSLCLAYLQAGIAIHIHADLSIEYRAWSRLYPDAGLPINDVDVTAGANIVVTLNIVNQHTGLVTMRRQGRATIYRPHISAHVISEGSAEWIVDRRDIGDTLMNFNNLRFTKASASDFHGPQSPQGGSIYNIVTQNDQTLTQVSVNSDISSDPPSSSIFIIRV